MFFKTATQAENNDIALKFDSEDYGGISCDNNITLISRQESWLASDMENTIRFRLKGTFVIWPRSLLWPDWKGFWMSPGVERSPSSTTMLKLDFEKGRQHGVTPWTTNVSYYMVNQRLVNTKHNLNKTSTRFMPAKMENISKGKSPGFWWISRQSESDSSGISP